MKMPYVFMILTLVSTLYAQEYESFFEEYDVILHQLQVNVLDNKGNPIRGLSKKDFELLLNGSKQKLETIEEIDLDAITEKADRAAKPVPESARRLFVLFFDLRYSTKNGVLQSQEAAKDFVATEILPMDLVGVFTYTQLAGISMITNFTNDEGHLLQAIDSLGLAAGRNVLPGPAGYYLDDVIDTVMSSMNESNADLDMRGTEVNDTGSGFAAQYIEELMRLAAKSERANYDREVLAFLGSMRKFGDGLRFIRGRKNILWFSSGFDATSLLGVSNEKLREYSLYSSFGDYDKVPSDQLGRGDVQSTARRAVESLQGSGSVVFSIDTSRVDEMQSEKNGLQTLNYFAVDTGGRVFSNRNEYLDSMTQVKDITSHYYLLSFYPEDSKKRNKVGKVKVKLTEHPKAKVYTNRGLLLDPDFQKMTKIEKNIHIGEYLARDQIIQGIPTNLSVLKVPMESDFTKLSLATEIGGDYFLGFTGKEKDRELEIYSIVTEKVSNRIFDKSYYRFVVNSSRIQSILQETGLKYFSNLFVKEGDYRVKIVIRDLKNGRIGSMIKDVSVGNESMNLAGPVVIEDETWVMVRQPEHLEKQYKSGNLDFTYPYRFGETSFTPKNQVSVNSKSKARFFYVLNYRHQASNQEVPQVKAMFQDKNGKYMLIPSAAISAETELLETAPHLTRVLVTIDCAQLKLKDEETYKLYVQFGVANQPALRSITDVYVAGL